MNDKVVIGEISSLAFGGYGVLKHEGLVTFVPFSAPGDLVKCHITQQKKRHAFGEILEIENSSSLRVPPKCPYFGTCGGCQLQHLNQKAQLDYKQQIVIDALERIGKIQSTPFMKQIVPPTLNWHYRRHITLTIENGQLGFIAYDEHRIVNINQCAIFSDEKTTLETAKDLILGLFQEGLKNGKLIVIKPKEKMGTYLFYFIFEASSSVSALSLEAFLSNNLVGIILKTANGEIAVGDTECLFTIDELNMTFSPKSFVQNHPEQSALIYREIVRFARETGSKTALDLYCGIGITALLLGKNNIEVLGIESNKTAIALAQQNCLQNHITNVTFKRGDVKQVLDTALKKKPDFVIVNPPRQGLDKNVVNTLLKHGPKYILYISCMPPTMARDLALLCLNSYQISSCQPFDMFPQTAHVETVTLLRRL